VYRGLTPSSFGQAGPGGAINLVTGSHPAVSDLRASRGSFGTWEGRVSGGRRVGRLSGSLHAGYQGSAGDFRYDDDNGTPLNAFDDTVSTRVNNRFDAATALGQLTWTPLERVRVVAREDVFRKAQGLAGLGAVPAWTPRLSLVRSLSQLEVTRAGAPARRWVPWLELRGSLDRERTRFRDTGLPDRGELGVGRHATDDRLASDALFGAAGWDGAVPGVALEVDGSLRSERARQQDAADGVPDPPLSRRAARGLGVALQVEPLGRWVLFHVAQRWDRIRDRLAATGAVVPAPEVARSLVTPQLGARVRGPAGFEARTNWTRATRVPDFLELFGNLGSVQGNPGLKPERGESWDAGGSWSGGRGRAHATLEWSHFESRTQELIVYLQNSASSVRARNLSSARVSGEELSLRCTVRDFTLTSASTWMSALNVGAIPAFWTGKRLPLHPARSWTARAQWNGAPLHAGIDVHYLGDNMLDPYNRLRVPSRTLLGASLALTRQFLTLTIEGKNLGDRRVSDVGGFPLPGRSLFVSLEAHAGALPSPSTGD
jgi:outer membrane receptor protein involved in Fe transport